MIDRARIISLNLAKYPFKVEIQDENKRVLRTFTFSNQEEAFKAMNEMSYEILKHHKKVFLSQSFDWFYKILFKGETMKVVYYDKKMDILSIEEMDDFSEWKSYTVTPTITAYIKEDGQGLSYVFTMMGMLPFVGDIVFTTDNIELVNKILIRS